MYKEDINMYFNFDDFLLIGCLTIGYGTLGGLGCGPLGLLLGMSAGSIGSMMIVISETHDNIVPGIIPAIVMMG